MTILVLGSNGSGKSAYAEKLTLRLAGGTAVYMATMIPYGSAGQARVAKHQARRASGGFITIEQPLQVSSAPLPPEAVILLEDVSNLLGNSMFSGSRSGNADSVYEDITALCLKCHAAVLVSITGLSCETTYNQETNCYLKELNRLNDQLSDFADTVIRMRGGEPALLKGFAYELD